MADPKIIIRRSSTPNKVPTENQLALGELAINTYDGKLYLEQDQTSTGLGVTVIAVNPWSVGVGSTAYDTYFTSGNVGLGLTNPTQRLDINGGLRIRGALYDSNNVVGAAGSILTSTGIGVSWTTPSAGGSGAQGAQGAQGFQGNVGSQGSSGSAGAQGAQGFQGDVGSQGSQGSSGSAGAQGAQGPAGVGSGESYWISTSVGIHTLSNVGVGVTNPTSKLTIDGSSKITGILTVGTAPYLNQNLNNGTIIAERIVGVHALNLPIGDYGIIGASSIDAFGISLSGFFDCLIEPMGVLATTDLGSL